MESDKGTVNKDIIKFKKICESCSRIGMLSCDSCYGLGEMSDGTLCYKCCGSGSISCDCCNGSGYVWYYKRLEE